MNSGDGDMGAAGRAPFSYRCDPAVPSFPDDRPIIIFDGKCVLCSGFARFILRTDRHERFRLLAAQSSLGAAVYSHFGLDPINYESNILLANGHVWLKSESSIRILEMLGFPWTLVAIVRLFPPRARDWLYDLIARNRLRWFGARKTCYLPDPAQAHRFLG
jgi:predicted DCC family thiol-disulfide oxidoreductase YuxK